MSAFAGQTKVIIEHYTEAYSIERNGNMLLIKPRANEFTCYCCEC